MVAVIGDPVAHSLSPVIHNAAFAHLGLDWVLVALPVPDGAAPAAVQGIRALGIRGTSVTMPHKAAVIAELDELTHDARRLGAVNCVTRSGDRLIGDNTDGAGFVAGLVHDFDFDPAGASCVVLGAGGAARAVVLALARAGAASVRVVGRTPANVAAAAELAGERGAVGTPDSVDSADLIVNATPVGMGDGAALPCDPERIGAGQIVADLVYHPLTTPLVSAALRRGARSANGVSMLVHQAAVAFTHWTGEDAPVEAMYDAVGAHIGGVSGDLSSKR